MMAELTAEADYIVIGLAGMAKNTGKTTAVQAIINLADSRGLRLGLTSIGYDGEAWDNVTRLPKPRIAVRAGTAIATAQSCLRAGSATVTAVAETTAETPLGRVVVGVARNDGTVVLAGPHTARELSTINKVLSKLGSTLIIVDGAINRIMPMSATDGIILATGAARHQDVAQVAQEAGAIARLFDLPQAADFDLDRLEAVGLFAGGRLQRTLSGGSILTTTSAKELAENIEVSTDMVVIPGEASVASLENLAHRLGRQIGKISIVLTDPLKLLLAGEPLATTRVLAEFERKGGRIAVLRSVPLLAITVNPFYPLWRYQRDDYQPAYVDAERLWLAVRAAVRVPVVDVKRQGAEPLLSAITSHLRARDAGDEEAARES